MLFFFLCASFALFPNQVLQGAQSGLALCINAVIPSLLPFLLLSSCLIKSNFSRPLGFLLSKILSPVTGLNPQECVCLITGLIGGYGAGAKAVKESYDNGMLTKSEAEALLSFANNAGPLFVIGTVGISFLSDKNAGVFLYFVQVITALLCASLFCTSKTIKTSTLKKEWLFYKKNKPSTGRLVAQAAASSGIAIINVCVFVISFSAALAVFPEDDFLFLKGITEVTRGCAEAARLSQNPLPVISAMLSWGGLSVHFQANALCGGELSLKKYYAGRVVASIISFIIANILCCTETGYILPVTFIFILTSLIYIIRRFYSLRLLLQS